MTNTPKIVFLLLRFSLALAVFFGYSNTYAQDSTAVAQDSLKPTSLFGKLSFDNPPSISSLYTYDPITDRYIYAETAGEIRLNVPVILTPEEYEALVLKEASKNYYQDKIDALEGLKSGSSAQQRNLIPDLYVNSGFFETLFGSNTISVAPQGSVEMDLGILYSRQDNPTFSPRNRSNLTFDFDQRIQLSLLGKVGTRLQVNANYDTESTFDFQNIFKLEFNPLANPSEGVQNVFDKVSGVKDKLDNVQQKAGDLLNKGKGLQGDFEGLKNKASGFSKGVDGSEDSIIQKIEVGNVSMPLNSSLISGAQSLFGFRTELKFGKTRIQAVFSEQKSQTRSVTAQGGGTIENFDFFGLDYEDNRHYFLAQYFRNHYDQALSNYPYINTNVQITRLEVWVTNRTNQTQNVRNILALQDLGESEVLGSSVNVLAGPGAYPSNANNGFDPTNIGGSGSSLSDAVRDISTVQSGILLPNINEGLDYGKLENARKLNQGTDYQYNQQLGYISLNQRLQNDEVLAVAFQYTVGGRVYQVGEFANDGVNATDVSAGGTNGQFQIVSNNNLILKMLKSTVTNVNEPIWDLMMKNIYSTGAYQLSQDDFRLNIFYTETAPRNYISPVAGTSFPQFEGGNTPLEDLPLLRVFNFDRLNFNNDPQGGGDGFFDYVPNITVIPQNGKIIFTKVEPFGRYLFDILDDDNNPTDNQTDYDTPSAYNPNQAKYVYDKLYKQTKTAALEDSEKNKFQLKGRYKSTGNSGIPIGFNAPRGSVKVTAGGRVLVEGVDYTVNYEAGVVQILDPALEASNVPIDVRVENNTLFGQQTRRFTGINVEHQFNQNFLLGATFLNLNERPFTQKANLGTEPINNTVLGLNGNFVSEVPVLTRLVNKLPNIDTDVESKISLRGEFAYLAPGSPKGTQLQGEATSYIDDFEGTQNGISLLSPFSWQLSSRPMNLFNDTSLDNAGVQNGYDRAFLNWYSIDPIFYTNQRPAGITDDDLSSLYTRRIYVNEVFPALDLVQGQTTVINSLDLTYYPTERGPYNFRSGSENGVDPNRAWAGISRQLTTTDFEQSNVEYIEFWLLDPFLEDSANQGGKLTINLGNISEDVLKDGRKQFENGLPEDGDISALLAQPTQWGTVVPQNQSLVYAFTSQGEARANQDVGLDGFDDIEEIAFVQSIAPGANFGSDPANDNYSYFLNTEGNIFDRYKRYNGLDGNSPDTFSDTNRGSTTVPDVEDINRDNTMNTIDSYFEYEIDLSPIALANEDNPFIVDKKEIPVSFENGTSANATWYQFRIPLSEATNAIGGVTDFRSIRFARLYLTEFDRQTTLRFASFDLVSSDWRQYRLSLDNEPNNDNDPTEFSIGVVGVQENDGSYASPPGIYREEINNNNTIIRQNEQSLVLKACDLESGDSRAVFKNISIDMRQFNKLRMFLHAEQGEIAGLGDGDAVGFIRMGNDVTQNYYQVEIPLQVSSPNASTPEGLWPEINEINLPLDVWQQIKSIGISEGSLSNLIPNYYEVVNGQLNETPVAENAPYTLGQQRVSVKGNPNFGKVRTLMVGIKNGRPDSSSICPEVWFNELRISDMDNEGGWAAILSMDSNVADFMNLSLTARHSTAGFGSVEQGPNERSREDVNQYDVVTNMNLGQLLPKKWGVQLPFNYGQSEALITPKYDQQYKDLELDNRLNAAESNQEREQILRQSEDYTRRQSVNFIGVRKQLGAEQKPRIYNVENLTLNYSYNLAEHRDFEIESAKDQNVRVGATYNFAFNPFVFEPFKKNDSIFTNKYLKLLKDFNLSLLPSNITLSANYNRQFFKQKFRDFDLGAGNIGIDELYRRNYFFDLEYRVNYNLTNALQFNFSASNNRIVRNYFLDNNLLGSQDPSKDVWDGFFDVGDPNRYYQQLGLTYTLPLDKIPVLNFIRASYAYNGDFQWQKGSDLFGNFTAEDGITYDLGNAISNTNSHNLNANLDMKKFYRNIKPTKRRKPGTARTSSKKGFLSQVSGILTSIERMQLNYTETNGSSLPGYLQSPGLWGTIQPTFGYTIGSQRDIRQLAAQNGWLTIFPEFNQQYTTNTTRNLDYVINVSPLTDLRIDFTGGRTYANNSTENFNTIDSNGDGLSDSYNRLITNSFGNFNISTSLIKTAFQQSDGERSMPFDQFRSNRLIIARRLAASAGIDFNNPLNFENGDLNSFPLGFGKNNQAVLLPAFLAAYSGKDANKISTSPLRDTPIPNWTLRYTGLMKLDWFKKNFNRFSMTHVYLATYTINQFQRNLDYNEIDFLEPYDNQPQEVLDQSGNYKNENLLGNVNLTEQFSPLIKIDMEFKSSLKLLAEIKTDRTMMLSFDNNLLTEIKGKQYTLGLGYRIKDLKFRTKVGGGQSRTLKSDLNMKADVSIRDNLTTIRYLDLDQSQVTAGQTIWSIKYQADYAFSKNLTGILYFDYNFSEYAISTVFPQTTIRSGITLKYNFGN